MGIGRIRINRRQFSIGAGAAIAGLCIPSCFVQSESIRRSNIILFVADDMRSDAAGFAGNPVIRTPNLDALAAAGVIFNNAFVTTSICCTSRASIWTGEYALRHRVYDFETPLHSESLHSSFFWRLRQAGYHTGFIGKWGVGGSLPTEMFDRWNGFAGNGDYYSHGSRLHLTDMQTAQALRFLRERPNGVPFLLVVAYKAPHPPRLPQDRFKFLYLDKVISRARSDTPAAAASLPALLKSSRGRGIYMERLADDGHYGDDVRRYYELITGIDESVGAVLAELNRDSTQDATSVFFTSDNGLLLGEHGLGGKSCMYEESIRVPLIVSPARRYFPSMSTRRTSAIALNVDLAPTIMSAAGVRASPRVQGENLFAIMENRSVPSWRDGFYYEHPTIEDRVACEGWRGHDWKYMRYSAGNESNECLFDLTTDPSELKNLAAEPSQRDRLQSMQQKTVSARRRWSV